MEEFVSEAFVKAKFEFWLKALNISVVGMPENSTKRAFVSGVLSAEEGLC
jgi:hypothetical protein